MGEAAVALLVGVGWESPVVTAEGLEVGAGLQLLRSCQGLATITG